MFDDDYDNTTDNTNDTTDNSESKEHTVYDDRVRDGQ
jgi:hypothetical protein